MKLIFFCSSLENGKDGVGDYTRRLGATLIRKGHVVSIIAISDRHINALLPEIQICEGQEITVLRFPKNISYNQKIGICLEFIGNFNPDWLSLQFVPFGFHDKGLPFGLSKFLLQVGGNRKWHIMFHELWVGMNNEATLKYKIWGKLQQVIIKQLISSLKPDAINTQCILYKKQLNLIGCKSVEILSLFGNIPTISSIKRANLDWNGQKKIALVVFGNIHAHSQIESFLNELLKINIDVKITFVGNNGNEKQNWIRVIEKLNITYFDLGEQSLLNISNSLQNADFGISTTPLILSEKSGTIATMLEHQLPVICIAHTWNSRYQCSYSNPLGISEYVKGNLKECLDFDNKRLDSNDVDFISDRFLNILNK